MERGGEPVEYNSRIFDRIEDPLKVVFDSIEDPLTRDLATFYKPFGFTCIWMVEKPPVML